MTDTLAVGPASAFTYSWTETTSTLTTMSGYFTQTVSVFPPTASSYTAEVFDSRNCISFPKTVNVDVQNCTGIQTNKFHAMSFSLYPNPVVDYLYWHSETKDISLVKIEISNAIGQVVYRQVNPTEEKADLKFLPSGFYYLSVFTKNEKQSFRFVKD